ncbi:MMS19 nucleotide excision repair protein homolog isoform X1 [Arachis ipaensis]|uniref:MMS19 nucleotide excision repair protein homolog isoform X1 n=1 Tax=Arachis ipaensis TaxID=130454 RepID=UPI000A2B30D3|nr:MMS19 nucleotide excision repair protein homolog isoform X1 [Arachis ipaensis]XP_025673824.1 MMS19 nucleotide excision repair protein homolog isoform X1 [Arachis hypogaea]QHN94744.1 uncharacterized protein DS421_18g603740 [Arachis hypogaea]
MAEPSELSRYIESYVDSSSTPAQQAASLDSVGCLVKSDSLTLEVLVRELQMYLTTTDNVIRARGILLLGEVLKRIESKPLGSANIHTLVVFFKDRLQYNIVHDQADWRALRGALIGCLALIRRKSVVGMVTGTDAKAIVQSFLEYVQVQSLGQYDRKLSLELLDCLLERYSDVLASLGEELIYGICEAVDVEKDPECLMLIFHIIETVGKLYLDPSGPNTNFVEEIFDILEAYFPIHFTHPVGDDAHVQRDDLSRALMAAFSSTPLFEPYLVPLLLEKLSSSLHSAKIDSLRYLRACSSKYGAERIAKYVRAMWPLIKDIISTYLEDPDFSFTLAPLNGFGPSKNELVIEALSLLQQLILQNSNLLVSLIIDDEDVNFCIKTTASYEKYNNIPVQEKKKLHCVGCILHVMAKTSLSFCNEVFQNHFSRIMDNVVSVGNLDNPQNGEVFPSERVKFGLLYLCIELLEGYRKLFSVSEQYVLEHETCCTELHRFSTPLFNAFCSVLALSNEICPLDPEIYVGVKGLQILAMFCSDVFPVPMLIFEDILKKLMSIIIEDSNKMTLWEAALKALFHIGSFVQKFDESEKAMSYKILVVEKAAELLSINDINLPLSLKVKALSEIGMTGKINMLTVLQGLTGVVFANVSDVCASRNSRSFETAVQLLECYSCKLLPWIHENGCSEEFIEQFAVDIWAHAGNCMDFCAPFEEKGLLDALMKVMKVSVASCSVDSQNTIILKAYTVLLSHTNFQLNKVERMPLSPGQYDISDRDEWILSLFASAIIAVCPKTRIPNIRVLLDLFMIMHLRGIVPAAQALGSIINKLASKSSSAESSSDLTLEEALDIIFCTKLWFSTSDMLQRTGANGSAMVITDLCLGGANDRLLQINAVCGLSWIGKGLLMCGQEKIKDIAMIFIGCLKTEEQPLDPLVMKCAADAFHVLMSDSDVCLNKKFHAIIRPLYKQRFFSSMMPVFQQLITNSHPSFSRSFLYRAMAHIISDTPLIVILNDANKLIPVLLDCMSILTEDVQDKDILYGLLLLLSGILTNKNGTEAVTENAHIIINCLTRLVDYPNKTLVRETAIQCLLAMSELPHSRIYPMRTQVLRSISKALDDKKRSVRGEAIRCRRAWSHH